jgi:hypothetical protein
LQKALEPVSPSPVKSLLLLGLLFPSLAATAEEFANDCPWQHQTKYFDFRFQTKSDIAPDLTRFADGFIDLLSRDFFKPQFDFPIRVLVLEDRDKFQDFLKRRLRMANPPRFGCYVPPIKTFVTYESAGFGTFAHEIIHPFIERNWPDRPVWTAEAIPTFFEKFYGYWKGDQLVLHWGFQNPWRIEALGPKLGALDLKAILTDPDETGYHESEQRMVSLFLWQQGCFKELLNVIARRDTKGYGSFIEAAMGRPIDEIVPLWQAYLKDVVDHRQEHLDLPPSTILEDEGAFRKFAERHHLRIEK